jgi:CHASE3 domain sensor protein
MKTLSELASEYEKSIDAIEEIVRETRAAMNDAKKKHNIDEIKSLGAKLTILYEEIRDMRIVSQKLRTYYDDETLFQEAI